jgi:hypothetical protein
VLLGIRTKKKTYNRRDSQMVTHSSTSRPVQCLCMAERTGCPVFTDLWSYVLVLKTFDIRLLDVCRSVASICGISRMVFDLVGPAKLDAMVVSIHIGVGRRLPTIISTQIESSQESKNYTSQIDSRYLSNVLSSTGSALSRNLLSLTPPSHLHRGAIRPAGIDAMQHSMSPSSLRGSERSLRTLSTTMHLDWVLSQHCPVGNRAPFRLSST